MTYKNLVKVIVLLFIFQSAFAERKDATLRDEDIAGSIVTVNYLTRPDNLIEYVYTLDSPVENKGTIITLLLDLSCSASFEPVDLPYAIGKPGYSDDAASLGRKPHTPSAIQADQGSAAPYAITVNGEALWGLYVLPGNSSTGLRLISAASPGMRRYEIAPWVFYDEENWILPGDDSFVPDTGDFTITGMIAGPGCPGVTEPPDSDIRFDGSQSGKESDEANGLLSYSAPLRDRLHVEAVTDEMTFHIFYSEDIDTKSFKVKPKSIKSKFNPRPGSDEIVTLSLKKNRTKFEFSVEPAKDKKSDHNSKKSNKSKKEYKDKDTFEIRAGKL